MFFLSRVREDDAGVCFSVEYKFRGRGGCHEVTGGLRSDVAIALARMVEAAGNVAEATSTRAQRDLGLGSWDPGGDDADDPAKKGSTNKRI
jgi:hypothetical protein